MTEKPGGFAELLERGGILYDLEGTSSGEVLSALVNSLKSKLSIPAEKLLEAVMEREALMSTGFGRGIAFPHPRNPMLSSDSGQFVSLAFSKTPVDWNSLDGEKVDTLLLIVTASAKQHLGILSEITFFCRKENFCRLLKERAPLEEILGFIRETESSWK